MKKFLASIFVLVGIVMFAQADETKERPGWIKEPLTYAIEHKHYTTAGWFYDSGMSNMVATESTARTRARQNAQLDIAKDIISHITATVDVEV